MMPEPHASTPPPLVARLLAHVVAAAGRRPRTVLAAAFLVAAASIVLFLTRLEYRTQRNDLISPSKDYLQRWNAYQKEFGQDLDIVVVVQGADRARMRQAVDRLAEQFQAHPGQFDRVFHRVDLRPFQDRALLYLPTEQVRQIQGHLQGMRLLLELGPIAWRNLSLAGLLAEAEQRLQNAPPGPMSAADKTFFAQLQSVAGAAAQSLDRPDSYRNPWSHLVEAPPGQEERLKEPQYFFSGDGSLAFLLARPLQSAQGGSFAGAQPSVAAAREIVAGVAAEFPDLRIGLTGLPVLESDEMISTQHDSEKASLLAVAGVTLLFFLVYRGLWYPLLTVSTLLMGTSWAMGWLTLTVGHLNILSATFAVMLIGMGDYGVLWVMRYEQERRRGEPVAAALRQTALCVGGGTVTAALTTALAFYAAMLADFTAVAELGWIAGSGVLLCALACFTVLPAVLTLCDRKERRRDANVLPFPPAGTWLPGVARHHRIVMVLGGLAILGLAAGIGRVAYDHNLLHLQDPRQAGVRWEMTLIDHTAGASWNAVASAATPEEALDLKRRFERLPEVSQVVEVASLLPRDQAAKLPLLADLQRRLRNLPEAGQRIPHATPNVTDLLRRLVRLEDRVQPLASAGGPLAPLPARLAELRRRLAATAPDVAANRMRDFEERLSRDLADDLLRLRTVSTPKPIELADVPPRLRERFVGAHGRWLVQVFSKDSLWDFGPLAEFCREVQRVDPEATGKTFSTVEGLRAMKAGFQWAGAYAFAAIVLVLLFDFRNSRRALVALAPLVAGLAVALGVMGWLGVSLNPANMIALPLILGVGVDNGVHVLHDFLARKAEGRFRLSRAIGRGVLVKALTTMIGFSTLMVSGHRGMRGLGFVLVLGVGCCMVTALVLLPALLEWVGARSTRRDAVVEAPRQAA